MKKNSGVSKRSASELTLIAQWVEQAVRRGQAEWLIHGLLSGGLSRRALRRLRLVQRLVGGSSYREIAADTGASFSTIAAVDRWLKELNPRYRRLFPLRHRSRDAKKHFTGVAAPGIRWPSSRDVMTALFGDRLF